MAEVSLGPDRLEAKFSGGENVRAHHQVLLPELILIDSGKCSFLP
jgi:hypothetical protein